MILHVLEEVEKSKNISKLHKKQIVDRRGKSTTVWVKPEFAPTPDRMPTFEDLDTLFQRHKYYSDGKRRVARVIFDLEAEYNEMHFTTEPKSPHQLDEEEANVKLREAAYKEYAEKDQAIKDVTLSMHGIIKFWCRGDHDKFLAFCFYSQRSTLPSGLIRPHFVKEFPEFERENKIMLDTYRSVIGLFHHFSGTITGPQIHPISQYAEKLVDSNVIMNAFIEQWRGDSRNPLCQVVQSMVAMDKGLDQSLYFNDHFSKEDFDYVADYIKGTKFEDVLKKKVVGTYVQTQKDLKKWVTAEKKKNGKILFYETQILVQYEALYKKYPDRKRRKELTDSIREKQNKIDDIATYAFPEAHRKELDRLVEEKLAMSNEIGSIFSKPTNHDEDLDIMSRYQAIRDLEYSLKKERVKNYHMTVEKNGKVYLTLYRGVREKYDIHSVLESWTSDERTASSFDGSKIIRRLVPLDAIYNFHESSTWFQTEDGLGNQEKEFIIINGGKLSEEDEKVQEELPKLDSVDVTSWEDDEKSISYIIDLEKSKKNLSKLQKKHIVDKRGKTTTVWVLPEVLAMPISKRVKHYEAFFKDDKISNRRLENGMREVVGI
jgi:hypothetical protein